MTATVRGTQFDGTDFEAASAALYALSAGSSDIVLSWRTQGNQVMVFKLTPP